MRLVFFILIAFLFLLSGAAFGDPGVGVWRSSGTPVTSVSYGGEVSYEFTSAVNSTTIRVQARSTVCLDTDRGTSTVGAARVSMYRAISNSSTVRVDSIAQNFIPYKGEGCLVVSPGIYWIEVDTAASGNEDPVVVISARDPGVPGEYTDGYRGRRLVYSRHINATVGSEAFLGYSNPVGSGVVWVVTSFTGSNSSGSIGMSVLRGDGDPLSDGAASVVTCLDNDADNGDGCFGPHNLFFSDQSLGQPNVIEWLSSSANVVTPANATAKRTYYELGEAGETWMVDLSDDPVIIYPGQWFGAFDNDNTTVNPLANVDLSFGFSIEFRPLVE